MDEMKTRLNRIEGQIKGIQKMYEEKRDCVEIVQQVLAVRQALGRVGKDLLTTEAVCCSSEPSRKDDFNKILKSLFDFS
jgi:DNA-binding FrmR family transcriptional regulator